MLSWTFILILHIKTGKKITLMYIKACTPHVTRPPKYHHKFWLVTGIFRNKYVLVLRDPVDGGS